MKTLSIILLVTILSADLNGQVVENRRQNFGVRVGANYSLMNFNKAFFPPNPAVKNVWKPGFTVGGFLQLHLSDRLLLQPEYAFTQMRGEDPRISSSYTLNYLNLPIFLRFAVLGKLSILAGPQFDLLVSGKEQSNGASSSIEHQTEERGIAAVAGIELQVYESFFVDLRYLKGLNHIGIQRSDINEFKWASITVAVGFHF